MFQCKCSSTFINDFLLQAGFYLGVFVWEKSILKKCLDPLVGGLGHAPPENFEKIVFWIGRNRISGR